MNILPPKIHHIPQMPLSEPPKKLQRMRDMRDNNSPKNIAIQRSVQQSKPNPPHYQFGETYPMYTYIYLK